MIVAVITVSVICQILYPVVFVLDAQKVKISCELRFVRLLFAHVNCSVTPCFYFVFSKNYRVGLRKIAEVLSPQRSGRRRSTRTNDHTMSEFTRTSLAAQPTAAQFARNTQMKLKQPSQFQGLTDTHSLQMKFNLRSSQNKVKMVHYFLKRSTKTVTCLFDEN